MAAEIETISYGGASSDSDKDEKERIVDKKG